MNVVDNNVDTKRVFSMITGREKAPRTSQKELYFIGFEYKLNTREKSRGRPITPNIIEIQNDSEGRKILSYHRTLLYDAYRENKN